MSMHPILGWHTELRGNEPLVFALSIQQPSITGQVLRLPSSSETCLLWSIHLQLGKL